VGVGICEGRPKVERTRVGKICPGIIYMAWRGRQRWHGTAGKPWYGMARHGMARHGRQGLAGHGMAGHGRTGNAWLGVAWNGKAR